MRGWCCFSFAVMGFGLVDMSVVCCFGVVAHCNIVAIYWNASITLLPYSKFGNVLTFLVFKIVTKSLAICLRYSSVVALGNRTLCGNHSIVNACRILAVDGM